ncbi:hypothetical protein Tco_1278578 [Tanacetum coccineum]
MDYGRCIGRRSILLRVDIEFAAEDEILIAPLFKSFPLEENDTQMCFELVCPIINAPNGKLLGAYDLGVVTPRALVHASDKTSRDARSWYMISVDAKS